MVQGSIERETNLKKDTSRITTAARRPAPVPSGFDVKRRRSAEPYESTRHTAQSMTKMDAWTNSVRTGMVPAQNKTGECN